MSRKTAREVAMKLAFARLSGGEDTYESVLEKSGISEKVTEADVLFSNEILEGVESNMEEIDSIINELSEGWKVERMPKVDLSILRIAIYEMLYREDIPSGVSINEAVELAKNFGGDRSASYINGMLGTLSKKQTEKLLNQD